MARWDRITSRGKVDDRRGLAPVVGGLSVTGIAAIVIINLLTGGDPADILTQLSQVEVAEDTGQFAGEDEYEVFASSVLGSANDHWREVFEDEGYRYREPTLVLFRQATPSACGTATSQVGPHYCTLDATIYLDETFFDELTNRLGARGGDVAEAYVIAHEVGHHVQRELGIMERNQDGSNESSINMELQADCFAGMWAGSVRELGVLEPGEIREAMDAAAAVGDDRIQERVTGYTNPETWTHGSSEQRVEWFTRGFNEGTLSSCNTFGNF